MPASTVEKCLSPLQRHDHVIFFVLFNSMKAAIDRLYYSITEVSKMLGEEQHVLRYWEREFSQLRPQKNRAGNRIYADKDLQVLRVIKRLLRDERYTVAGAKEFLRQHGVDEVAIETSSSESAAVPAPVETPKVTTRATGPREQSVREVVAELRSIANDIRQRVSAA